MGIIASHSIEERRQHEQTRLDSLKTPSQRNKWGQFATPPELALSLARYARPLIGKRPVRFLDPAIGTGSFFSATLQVFGREDIVAAAGVELDPLFARTAATLWEEQGLHVVKGDFTKERAPEQRFNLVLTNPPYVRHHHLSAEEKDRLRAQLARALYLDISGLAGLYCYFLLLCHDWMDEQGLAIWLIPSEFMDVNYGLTFAPISYRASNAAAYSPLLPNGRPVCRRLGILRRRGIPQITAAARPYGPILVCRPD